MGPETVNIKVKCECGMVFNALWWSHQEWELHAALPADHPIGTIQHRGCRRVFEIRRGDLIHPERNAA
jgi:hypothetical protein